MQGGRFLRLSYVSLGFVPNQGGILAGACVCRLQRLQADAGSDSLLFSLGYRWGISIDRSSSPTYLTSIRDNFTSLQGTAKKKKELRSVGPPTLTPTFSSLKSTTSGRGRIRTYVENLQQIYSLSLLTTRPLSPSRADAPLNGFLNQKDGGVRSDSVQKIEGNS